MIFNQNIVNLKGSASVELMQKAEQLEKSGADIVNMAGGEPDFATPERICRAADQAIRDGFTHYAVGKGIPELREKIAKKLNMDNGIRVNPDQVILTPGGKYGIYLAICSLVNPQDEVIILNPGWVSYGSIVASCGAVPVEVELDYEDHYHITKEKIMAAVTAQTKALIINYPNNPTGRILHRDEAEVLAEIIRETGIYVVSDEIYEKVIYDGLQNISLASIEDVADHVITVNGFSKSVAMTGWRLGYVAASPEMTAVMYKLYTHTITGTSTFIQKAALEAFHCDDEIEMMRKTYEDRRNRLIACINQVPGMHCEMPEGAFYAWVHFDTGKTSFEVADALLSQGGIVGVPGQAYGSHKTTCMRFSFACSEEILDKMMERIQAFMC